MLQKTKALYTFIFLIFCIALIGSITLLYLWRKKPTPVKPLSSSPQQITPLKPTHSPTNIPLPEQSEKWTVYTTPDFSVRIPPHTTIKYGRVFEVLKWDDIYGYIINPEIENAAVPDWYQVEIYVVKNIPEKTTKEFADSYTETRHIETSYSEYLNNRFHGYSLTLIQNTYPYKTIFMVKNNTLFVLRVSGQYGTNLTTYSKSMLDQITATFASADIALPDRPIEKLISLKLPNGWTQHNDKGTIPGYSGQIKLLSPDSSTDPNYYYSSTGIQVHIEVTHGGTIDTLEKRLNRISNNSRHPMGGGVPSEIIKESVAGRTALSSIINFEGYDHTYTVWNGDNIWTIDIVGSTPKSEELHANEIKSILDSIVFL